jgi:hypothetical protein
MTHYLLAVGRIAFFFFTCLHVSIAQDSPAVWPKEITTDQGQIVVYQPQPSDLDGSKLTGTAAFSILPQGKNDPLFGALFFSAMLDFDRENHLYTLRSCDVTNVRFASQDSTIDMEKVKAGIVSAIPTWNFTGSTDQLITTIERASLRESNAGFKNDPPAIIYRSKPAVLVLIDGEPKFQPMEGTDVQRLVNSPFLVMKYGTEHPYYLYGGDNWMTSSDVTKGWTVTKNVPGPVKKALEKNTQPEEAKDATQTTDEGVTPEIVVSTKPAELIQTNGPANYVPLTGIDLLYVDNSDDYILKELTSQKSYILKSGRWYASTSIEGPWLFVAADSLPSSFAQIPPGSPVDGVLASVPGTPQSKDAVLDAQVPQTATVDRKTAGKNVQVTFDGEPKFEAIEGTSLQLAVNSSSTVFKFGATYYVVDNGVWFESKSYKGPWEVSTSRPTDIDKIPASNPAYNTKYVYIYDSTPDVVYVGYTPGYMGAYVYGPTVVYGTGWHYSPWVGTTYYARPCTWGFGMHYSPWTGWSMSIGYTAGPWSFGFGGPAYAYGGGWFGPPMYYPHYYYPPRYYGPSRGYYGPRPAGPPNRPTYKGPITNYGNSPRQNMYNRPGANSGISSGIAHHDGPGFGGGAGAHASTPKMPAAKSMPNRPNNVYSDRAGNVYKNENGNWQQHANNGWKDASPAQVKNAGGMMNEPANRDRATQRYNGFQQSHPSPGGGGMSRPGGMPAGRPMPRKH